MSRQNDVLMNACGSNGDTAQIGIGSWWNILHRLKISTYFIYSWDVCQNPQLFVISAVHKNKTNGSNYVGVCYIHSRLLDFHSTYFPKPVYLWRKGLTSCHNCFILRPTISAVVMAAAGKWSANNFLPPPPPSPPPPQPPNTATTTTPDM